MQYLKAKLIATALLASATTGVLAGDRASRMFDKMDVDGDSQISLEEFQPPMGARMLQMADLNDDGQITLEEAQQAQQERIAEKQEEMRARQAGMQEHMNKMFAEMDVDGDGSVTQEEIRVQTFNRMDTDKDGFISASEVKQAGHHKKMRKMHHAHS